MERLKDLGLLVLRVGAGVYLLAVHGWPKIVGSIGDVNWMASVTERLGGGAPALLFGLVAVNLELLGGLLAALGIFTRTVSACLALYVAGAYLIGLGLGGIGRTLVGGGLALLLVCTGPGRYSLDEFLTPSSGNVVVNSTELPGEDA